MAHDESIAKEMRVCVICEEDFEAYIYRNTKTCGKEGCKRESQSINISGEDHPMYGVTGEDHPVTGLSRSEEWKEDISEGQIGEKNNNWNGKSWDEESVEKWRESRGEFSHSEEYKEMMSISQMGENNTMYGRSDEDSPSWKPDSTTRYSLLFKKNREKVLERDDFECRICGLSQKEHKKECGRSLHIHHIIPRSEFMEAGMNRPPNEAAKIENLIAVCQSCHRKAECSRIAVSIDGGMVEVHG